MLILNKVKQDPVKLLAVLLALHLIAVSFNRAPSRPEMTFGRVWLMTLYWPFQYVAAHGLGSFRNAWNHYFLLRDARLENEQLKAKIGQLSQQLREAEDKGKVGDELSTYVKWRSGSNYPAIDARVIARDANQWFNSIVIDQGSLAGVQKDMPVVTPAGLVGRVVFTSPLAARVLLLTDERHGAGALIGQLADTRSIGVVKGRNKMLCEMRFVAAAEKVTPGEPVLTSGQDGLYPRGLLIGHVRLTPGTPGVPPFLEIEPAVALDKLDMVAVLQVPKDQTRAKTEELIRQEAEKQQSEKPQGRRR
jgi:rod shape-determining protein MreC